MSGPHISSKVEHMLAGAFDAPSLLDRLRGNDRRRDCLDAIAGSGEYSAVQGLVTLLARNDALSTHVAGAIDTLLCGLRPTDLAFLDQMLRGAGWMHSQDDSWWSLSPERVGSLARTARFSPTVLGVLACHHSGFVRAAALEHLATATGGAEIPFLALRANDWVRPVAARASELLIQRLSTDNRVAVIDALPFIIRMLRRHRRDHSDLSRALRTVLLSDGGSAAIEPAPHFDTEDRRFLYDLLLTVGAATSLWLTSALTDGDAVIRARAVKQLAAGAPSPETSAVLARLVVDNAPAVRVAALTALAEHPGPELTELVRSLLVDRSGSVRALARYIVHVQHLPIVPRDIYTNHLGSASPRQLVAAIDGIGESGTAADADLLTPFLTATSPRVRRVALRVVAGLDAARAISLAMSALGDHAPSVQVAAARLLAAQAHRVDFPAVNSRLQWISDPRGRCNLLRLLTAAPKWDAVAYLMLGLGDADEGVRSAASQGLNRWVADFNRTQISPTAAQLDRAEALVQTAASRMSADSLQFLRFILKSL